jgi:hypothetical protein
MGIKDAEYSGTFEHTTAHVGEGVPILLQSSPGSLNELGTGRLSPVPRAPRMPRLLAIPSLPSLLQSLCVVQEPRRLAIMEPHAQAQPRPKELDQEHNPPIYGARTRRGGSQPGGNPSTRY